MKILIVTSNTQMIENKIPTGVWLEEFAIPYSTFEKLQYSITVASPLGGKSPIDPKSFDSKYLKESIFLNNTIALSDLDYKKENFDAIFVPGGHGCMFDLPQNQYLGKIIQHLQQNRKIISAVCHGVCGLLGAKEENNSNYYVKNKSLTSFTNEEEGLVDMVKYMPFLLQTKLENLGADFSSSKPWDSYVVENDYLLTGQNQNSVQELTKKLIAKIQKI